MTEDVAQEKTRWNQYRETFGYQDRSERKTFMADQKLKDALGRLKGAVNSLDPADSDSRELLKELAAEIEVKLNQKPSAGTKADLQETLRDRAAQFKVRHPLISNLLDEISDVLTHLGI